MTPLMPNLAKGHNVYRPSQGTYGAASTTLQQLSTHGDNPNDNGTDSNDNGDEPSGYLAMYFSNLTSFEQLRVDVIRL